MKKQLLLLTLLGFMSCNQDEHQEPIHNFTVNRLIILNDTGEVLMVKVASNWYTLSAVYNKRQYIRESLDSLSNAYGVKTTTPQLRGYFSYKYEYHNQSTLRGFYVANYLSGDIIVPKDREDVKWVPVQEALTITPVQAMKEGIHQILTFPDAVWGGSFMVYRDGEAHKSYMTEEFYPLFQSKK